MGEVLCCPTGDLRLNKFVPRSDAPFAGAGRRAELKWKVNIATPVRSALRLAEKDRPLGRFATDVLRLHLVRP
jgi:hypothetical protein